MKTKLLLSFTLVLLVLATLLVNPALAAPPKAKDDFYSTDENSTLTEPAPGVLGNDEGVSLSAIFHSNPSNGSLTLNIDGSFSYAPNPNFNGIDSFTYRANDGNAQSNVATVTITVNSVNDKPTANFTFTTSDLTANFTSTSTDTDGTITAYAWNFGDGTTSTAQNPTHTYATAGTRSVQLTVTDNDGDTDSISKNVSVTAPNQPPTAVNDSYITAEDSTLNVAAPGVLGNDTDPEAQPLTATLQTAPRNGTLTLNRNGSFIYKPNVDFNGSDSATYVANDGTLDSNVATVTFTVTAVSDPPVVSDIPDQTIDEGQTFATIPLDNYVDDVDNLDSEITWTYAGNTDLTVSIDTIRVATITIPTPDLIGAETITFTATDP